MNRKKAEKLAAEIAAIDSARDSGAVLTPARAAFLAYAEQRGKVALHAGWPDFLVEDAKTSSVIGVKVIRNGEPLLPSHERMFAMLEHARVHVYIWSPTVPARLTPWRRYALEGVSLRQLPHR